MIKKLQQPLSSSHSISDMHDKINELIDVVNKLTKPKYRNGRKTPLKKNKPS